MKKLNLVFVFSLVVSLFLLSCSTDDDLSTDSDQFLNADINGVLFNSSENVASINLSRDYNSMGTVSLYVRSVSNSGESLEFHIDNFVGKGKYSIGDQAFNRNWMSYKSNQNENLWSIMPNSAMNDENNFIEITLNEDDQIKGKINCSKMWSQVEGKYGIMPGDFQLNYAR